MNFPSPTSALPGPRARLDLLLERLRREPRNGELLQEAASLALELGDPAGAAAQARQLVRLHPQVPLGHFTLGRALAEQGDWRGALAAFTRAATLNPGNAATRVRLAQALTALGRHAEALALARDALAHGGLGPMPLDILGRVFQDLGEPALACQALAQAVALSDQGLLRNNHGTALREAGRHAEALEQFRLAVEREPAQGAFRANLGKALCLMGDVEAGLPLLEEAIALEPGEPTHAQAALFHLNAHPEVGLEEACRKTRAWMERLYPAVPRDPAMNRSLDRNTDRKLRIGYVSPDFRAHAMRHWILPLLEHRDRSAFEVVCFSCNSQEDPWTRRFKALSDRWVRASGLAAEDLARKIRSMKIDILVDLAGPTAGNRLDVFALKPAPVQVSMLGFDRSLGLRALDWRITHAVSDPPGDVDRWNVERIWRLEGRFAYAPHPEAPEPGPLPALERGHLTFGFLGNHARVGRTFLRAAARLLGEIPGSRLALLWLGEGDETHRAFKEDLLRQAGLDPARVDWVPRCSPETRFLACYRNLDITLNSFPAEGGTTICESLWMGVPVLALDRPEAHRHTARSILGDAGLGDWVAGDLEAWIATARRWSRDLPALAELRAGLRGRMAAGPVCDGPASMRAIEAAYRGMWKEGCRDATS